MMNGPYEVLSPWAAVEPRPLHGISPRIAHLEGQKIGLFSNSKSAAPLIMTVLEKKLTARFPDSVINRYETLEPYSTIQMEGGNREKFEAWLKGVDTVIAAVGD